MTALDLDNYVDALRRSLEAVAAAGTEQTRETAHLLAGAVEPAVRLVLIDALSAMAAEVTAAWDGGTVDVRVRGGRPEVVVFNAPVPGGDEPTPSDDGPRDAEGAVARISLRMPEGLKARADAAAAATGMSLNTWLVRAVADALGGPRHGPPSGRGPRRYTGFARS
ncbi:MAG TPA: toxin-antitoxin system HicB family antitoxin [Geodermatophilus sp.]|nr:toxin-antitoxin system HicB family antitoxin [Geodermatophilus sp.]